MFHYVCYFVCFVDIISHTPSCLIMLQNFLAPGELDPLNRRLGSEKKPDVVVQVVVLAQDNSIKAKLQALDIEVQTVSEVAPIEVQPARVLSKLYAHLG